MRFLPCLLIWSMTSAIWVHGKQNSRLRSKRSTALVSNEGEGENSLATLTSPTKKTSSQQIPPPPIQIPASTSSSSSTQTPPNSPVTPPISSMETLQDSTQHPAPIVGDTNEAADLSSHVCLCDHELPIGKPSPACYLVFRYGDVGRDAFFDEEEGLDKACKKTCKSLSFLSGVPSEEPVDGLKNCATPQPTSCVQIKPCDCTEEANFWPETEDMSNLCLLTCEENCKEKAGCAWDLNDDVCASTEGSVDQGSSSLAVPVPSAQSIGPRQ